MIVGTQYSGSQDAATTVRYLTSNWPATWDVVWTVIPTSPGPGSPQLEWDVTVSRESDANIAYWIDVHNLTSIQIGIDLRFAIMNL